jgi:hypothetical protein
MSMPTYPRRRSSSLGWEHLETRLAPSLSIQLDYSHDSLGFFTQNPGAQSVLQEAADILGSQFNDSLSAITPNPGAGNTWTATFLDPSGGSTLSADNLTIPANTILVYAGGFVPNGSFIGFGGPGGYSASGTSAWINQVKTRGASPNIGIWGGAVRFSTTANWSFAGPSVTPPAGRLDFLSVAEHELGHVLGIGTSAGWQADVVPSNDTFVGPHAEALLGGPVPLNTAGQFGEAADTHWGSSVTSFGQVPTMSVSPFEPGQRREFTSVDWAGLQDIGWHDDHLVVTGGPPARVVAGTGFALTVAAEDPDGHVNSTFQGQVSLSLEQGAAGAALGGVLTTMAENGVAGFVGLTLSSPGDGYAIQASSALVHSATSAGIVVVSASATPQLLVATEPPTSVVAGSPFGLTMMVQAPDGQVDTAFQGTVTLGVASGPLGAGVGGPLTVAVSQGIANFSALSLNRAGSYTLRATGAGVSPVTTAVVTVIPAPASQLVVSTQPPSVVAFPNSFSFVVTAEDAYGNAAGSFGQPLTASLIGTVGNGFSGTGIVVVPVNGVATFSDFFVGTTGTGYTIRVSTGDGSLSVSTIPFNVTRGSSGPPAGSAGSLSIIGERILTAGKGKQRHVAGFELIFSSQLNASRASRKANYTITERVKLGRKLLAQPVRFVVRYDPASSSVSLLDSGHHAFTTGGRITINATPPRGITDRFGTYLDGNRLFTILPKALGVIG